jgi:hypothetical protein
MQQEGANSRFTSPGYRVWLLVALLMTAVTGRADSHNVQDIAPFGLLNVDTRFDARYIFDERERASEFGTDSFESRTTWEEEFFVMTESFVYHPGFLNMELGGGPLLVQQQYESGVGDAKANDTLLNVIARLNFLELKSYPFSLYYERSHPSITTSLSGRFLTQSDRYGFISRIAEPWKSASIDIDLSRQQTEGSDLGSIVDNDVENSVVTLMQGLSNGQWIEFKHQHSVQDSRSGSTGLPVRESTIAFDHSTIRAHNLFGDKQQLKIDQTLRRFDQDVDSGTVRNTVTSEYFGRAFWDHSERARSRLIYRYSDIDRDDSQSTMQDVELGTAYEISEELRYDLAVGHEAEEQRGFTRDQTGAKGVVYFSQDSAIGRINVAASVEQQRTDQKSEVSSIEVFDEALVLNGTTPMDLANDFVDAVSVVVSNATRTQTFVEGLDYRLVIIGATTSVQRLVGSNIADGETVLVDYRFQTSGTANFDSLSSSLSVNLAFLKAFNAFARLNTRETDIRDGAFTTPINDADIFEVGLSANYPAFRGLTIGGEVRHTDQREDISPFVRDSADIFVTTSLRGRLRLRVSGGVLKVDYERSDEDVDQSFVRLGLAGRVWRRLQFSVDSAYLKDTGGSLARDQFQHRVTVQWAYRQVRFDVRAILSDESLGTTERTSSQISAQLTRIF